MHGNLPHSIVQHSPVSVPAAAGGVELVKCEELAVNEEQGKLETVSRCKKLEIIIKLENFCICISRTQ